MGAVISLIDWCLGRHDHHTIILQVERKRVDYETTLKHLPTTPRIVFLIVVNHLTDKYIMKARQYVIQNITNLRTSQTETSSRMLLFRVYAIIQTHTGACIHIDTLDEERIDDIPTFMLTCVTCTYLLYTIGFDIYIYIYTDK